jgi:hypothetical protein
MPIGSGKAGLEGWADSFAGFLYRFWIENEIALPEMVERCVSLLSRR